ncbi:MAG: hypothetical protein VX496_04430, partial [Planctomycetota bacterium]|nr:hypothetical protein [Planctomycetota bacterium]
LARWAKETPREIAAIASDIEDERGIAVDHESGRVSALTDGEQKLLFCREDLQLRGDFNLLNAATAAAAATGMGINPAEILAAVRSFTGVEHRLQSLGAHD